MIVAQNIAGVPSAISAGRNTKLIDSFLNITLLKISPEWRHILIPQYSSWTSDKFISAYEKLLSDGTAKKCFIPDDVLNKYSDLYSSLKEYINVLSCNKKTENNFTSRCQFMTRLGFSESSLKNFYDPELKRFKLFAALKHFVFEALEFNETETLILKHHLNYSNEYEPAKNDTLPGRPGIEKGYLLHTAEVVKHEIEKCIYSFTALQPWIDYGNDLDLTNDFIILTPAYLEHVKAVDSAEFLTLPFLAEVLAVIYNYSKFIIELDEQNKYNLIKEELLCECGIPPNVRKIQINTKNQPNEPSGSAILKRLFTIIYKTRDENKFSLN